MPGDNSTYSRFKIWDAGGIAYSHTELATNWEVLEAILGNAGAGAATWPPTTGDAGGIYREVALLQQDRVPIGTVIPWFRPDVSVSAPTGWVICDGLTTVSSHDFVGFVGSFTIPDYRNRFIVGANIANSDTTAATVGGNAASDAPGIRGSGGTASGSHSHTTPDHYHIHSHIHAINLPASGTGDPTTAVSVNGTGATFVAGQHHQHTVQGSTVDAKPVGSVLGDGQAKTHTSLQTLASGGTNDNPTGGNEGDALATSTAALDNRPNYAGLLYIMKVKYATTP